jgi:hypothetical protein
VRVFVAIVLAVGACTPQRTAELPAPPMDKARLSHDQHAQLACAECHGSGTTRPGSRDHAPCDGCHRAAFLGAPGPMCDVCHEPIKTAPLVAQLKPFPSEDTWRTEPSRFSHRSHLDAGRIEARVGFHVTCADCHVRDGKLAPPDHATCSRCHAREASSRPAMDDCAGCHGGAPELRTRARLIRGDLHFSHDLHRADRRGTPIRCEQCHEQSAAATGYADHAAPRVESCVSCHDDTDRTPPLRRMRICETCHSERSERLLSIAPRNHLPATERPLDHTIAFRRDHADAAEHDAARCAACHTQMSGNPAQACDECHQSMRPADHRITWRELDHGPEAAADRDRCARCHVVEFCTACHQQRPRSHGFAGTFVSDHGPLARTDVRACLTCHQESFCTSAGCHAGVKR